MPNGSNSTLEFGRQLTQFEERADFKAINKAFDDFEQEFIDKAGPIQKKQIRELLKDIERILRSGDHEKLADVKVKFHKEHVQAIREVMRSISERIVNQTALELPGNRKVSYPQELRARNAIKAEALAKTMEERMLTTARMTVLGGLERRLKPSEIMFQLRNPTT